MELADTGDEPSPTPGNSAYVVRYSRRAMACQFEVLLPAGEAPASEAAVAALDLVEALERQLTVYRDDSEIAQLNRTAHEAPREVEPKLFELLAFAEQLHQETEGAFDLTAGPLIKTWGFYRRAGRLPSEEEIAAARQRVGMRYVRLDAAQHAIQLLREGVELNLGAIGKGYAVDRAAETLRVAGLERFAWTAGQSSVLCAGDEFPDQPGAGWQVGVGHPLQPGRRLGSLRLRNRALATSGSGVQFFRVGERRFGHILDPRSGWPAEGVLSVTAVTPSAAWSDALSTALYVLGPERGAEYCQAHPQTGALWVVPGEKAGQIELRFSGIEPDDWNSAM